MTSSTYARGYWRIGLVAVLGALLAFASSFLVSPTYQTSTRLIIHGRDANFLSSSGQNLSGQTSITDSAQAAALTDTYASIATSRGVAAPVVDRLHLDKQSSGSGIFHAIEGGFAWLYRCGRAFITSGFCASVNEREKAITDVQNGTTAEQLGTTAGATAGQPGSYVLEITGSGDSGRQAQAVTNALADQLVQVSSEQVHQSIETYIGRVQKQLTAVRKDVQTKTDAVTTFEQANNVSASDQQLVQTATAYDDLKASLNTARADLADAQAQLTSINSTLAGTAATSSSDQQIDTGRSGTTVTTNQANPVYTDLLSQQSSTEAKITGLQARISELEGQVASGSPTTLSGTLAQLADLQDNLTAAQKNRDDLMAQLADAQTQAATAAPDLSRIDTAGRPDYPVSPKRWVYLLIGLLLGALAGGGLTWLARRRVPADLDGTSDDDSAAEDEVEEITDPLELLELQGVPHARGASDEAAREPDDNPVTGVTELQPNVGAGGRPASPEP